MRCPICRKEVQPDAPFVPFCSDRCRIIDLGKWSSGSYVISSPVKDTEESIREIEPEDPGEDG